VTSQIKWELICFGAFAVPLAVTAVMLMARWPRTYGYRGLLAVLAGWLMWLAYTLYLHNPAGIAYFQLIGTNSPETRFDNNTVASAMLGGWFYPSILVALVALIRVGLRRARASA
jgi:hypothetical protein